MNNDNVGAEWVPTAFTNDGPNVALWIAVAPSDSPKSIYPPRATYAVMISADNFKSILVGNAKSFDSVVRLQGYHPKQYTYNTEAMLYGIKAAIEWLYQHGIDLGGREINILTKLIDLNKELNKPPIERVLKNYKAASGKSMMKQADVWGALDSLQMTLGFKLSGLLESTLHQAYALDVCKESAKAFGASVFSPITEEA